MYLSRATSVGIKFINCAAINEFFASDSVLPVLPVRLAFDAKSHEVDRLFLCCSDDGREFLSTMFGNE